MYLKWGCLDSSWCGLCYIWQTVEMFKKLMNLESSNNNYSFHWWKQINYSKFVCCRTEAKVWSPLVSEEGKTHPYKMNLASEPQVSPGITALVPSHSCKRSSGPDPPRSWAYVSLLIMLGVASCPILSEIVWPLEALRVGLPPSRWEACCCGELIGCHAWASLLGSQVSPAICMLPPTTGHGRHCRGVAQ